MAAPLLPEEVEKIVALYRAGYSKAEIARRTGHGRSTVVRHLARLEAADADEALAASPAGALTAREVRLAKALVDRLLRFTCPQCQHESLRLDTMNRGVCPACRVEWSIM